MKVKDLSLLISCVDGELDVRIQDQEGAPVLLLEHPEGKYPVMVIHPVSGAFETNMLIGMYVAGARSAQEAEERKVANGIQKG